MNIEHLGPFHQVRRILRTIAADYRLVATPDLALDESILDARGKSIEVSTHAEVFDAAALALFQVGHLRLLRAPSFALLFGEGVKVWKGNADLLVERLARLGARADQSAAAWAKGVFEAHFPHRAATGHALIERSKWSRDEWRAYFSA